MMRNFALALGLVAGLAMVADAGPFRRGGRVVAVSAVAEAKPAAKPATAGNTASAQGVAVLIVETGRFRHWGGNPFAAEGIGMGPSPAAALANCCFYGRRQIADVGYAQTKTGAWVAVARYR